MWTGDAGVLVAHDAFYISINVCCVLQIAADVKKYKERNPGWHYPKSMKKRVG